MEPTNDTISTSIESATPAVEPSATPAYVSYDDFKKVEVKVGKILSVVPVEKSEKLLLLSVDFGEAAPRTVVSGIAKHFPDPSVLVGISCSFVTNLEPRPLMGHISQAMIFAAGGDDGSFSVLRADGVPAGSRVG